MLSSRWLGYLGTSTKGVAMRIGKWNIGRKDPTDAIVARLKEELPPRSYTRCVWLLDQQEFNAVRMYLDWKCAIALRVNNRITNEVVASTLDARFRHSRRVHFATLRYHRIAKVLGHFITYQRSMLWSQRAEMVKRAASD